MRVAEELFGELRRHVEDGSKFEVEVEEGTTVGLLISRIGLKDEDSWTAAINGQVVYAEDALADGAVLILFPPIAGG